MATQPEPFEGTFWQINTSERRVPGLLHLTDDDPQLVTHKPIFTERSFKISRTKHGMTIGYSGDAEDLVDDFQPRTIHGALSDGTVVSIIDAQGGKTGGGFGFEVPPTYHQQFRARKVVMGELVTQEQAVHALRFQVSGPYWHGPTEDVAHSSDGSTLRLYRDDDGRRWFEFINRKSLQLNAIEPQVLNAVTTLTSLVTDNDAADVNLHIKISPTSSWRAVHRRQEAVNQGGRSLLDTDHLTAAKFAHWIDFRARTDGLDAAALDELDGVAIQTQVLALAAVAEGLHRRLFDGKRRIPGLSNNKIGKMRRAARGAALPLLPDPQFSDGERAEFANAVQDAFASINEQTFRSRMADLLNDARMAIPEIGAAFADWPDAVSAARNILVHQPALPPSVTSDQFLELLIALSYSISWVLRTNLLNEAGFDPLTLQRAYHDSSAYRHHVTNTRMSLADGPFGADSDVPPN